jgi:hypothetical protein
MIVSLKRDTTDAQINPQSPKRLSAFVNIGFQALGYAISSGLSMGHILWYTDFTGRKR